MNKSFEYAQKIKSHYVGDDCVQIMVPHFTYSMTIIDENSIRFHERKNSDYYINSYLTDKRALQFPYSEIPEHKRLVGFKKIKYINQLFEFNKPYITMKGSVIENFVVKDGNEAILITKILQPHESSKDMISRNEVEKHLITNDDYKCIFMVDGGLRIEEPFILPESEIIETIKSRYAESVYNYDSLFASDIDKALTKRLLLAKDFIPISKQLEIIGDEAFIFDDLITVSKDGNGIKQVKGITSRFVDKDKYETTIYDFPARNYTLREAQQVLQTNFIPTREPKISSFLNKGIDKELIKQEKVKVKQLIKR